MTTKPGPNTPARPLTQRSVHHLLRNPYYQGVVTFNQAEHPGAHEPLVDPVTWATVQDVLATHRNGERSRAHDHYLKGTVYCIECDRRLIVQHTRRNDRVYEYFVCHRRGNNDCTQRKALPIAQVEQRVADCYHRIALTATQREQIEEIALAKPRRQHALNAERLDQLTNAAAAVEANRGKLLDAYYADAVPRDLFLSEQRRLKADHARLEHDRKAAEANLAHLEQQTREALDLLQDAHEAYERATGPIRKQLNQALFARILLGHEQEQIQVQLNQPYAALTTTQTNANGGKHKQNRVQ